MEFQYAGYEIHAGKPPLPQLPATYVTDPAEAETLIITLVDPLTQAKAALRYTIYSDLPVITRSVTVENGGDQVLKINRLMSASFDLPDEQLEFVQLSGAWGRERHI
ncbi:hypothetical protein D3C75_1161270 [compost metagenome]